MGRGAYLNLSERGEGEWGGEGVGTYSWLGAY